MLPRLPTDSGETLLYFIQGRGGDDSYDPFVATAIVLGLSAQIVASVLKMRDGTDVESLCVCGGVGAAAHSGGWAGMCFQD